VAESVGVDEVDQILLDGLLSGNILKTHVAKIRECERGARGEMENLLA